MHPIQTELALPEPGADRETGRLDFKQTVSPKNHVELAKDVTAFANAFGGHVLVGAVEDPATGRLDRYEPLPGVFAHEVATAYDQAVATRCFPKPLHDAKVLARGAGFVVAVNVWAYPGGAVGVRSEIKDAYLFPVRVGAQTDYLRPEVLPMLMSADVRRVAILLDQIPEEKRQKVQLFWREHGKTEPHLEDLVAGFKSVRPMENVAVFSNANRLDGMYPSMAPTSGPPINLHIPLDAIRSVWSDGDGDWCVLMNGKLDRTENEWWAYFPGKMG